MLHVVAIRLALSDRRPFTLRASRSRASWPRGFAPHATAATRGGD